MPLWHGAGPSQPTSDATQMNPRQKGCDVDVIAPTADPARRRRRGYQLRQRQRPAREAVAMPHPLARATALQSTAEAASQQLCRMSKKGEILFGESS